MKFQIISDYKPAGDQPQAIKEICSALNCGVDDILEFVPEKEGRDNA